MGHEWAKFVNDCASYFFTPAGKQLVALAGLVLLTWLIAKYARLSMRDLDEVIDDNIRLEERRSRGRPPVRKEAKMRRYQQLENDVSEQRALLEASMYQFVVAVWLLPTILLMYIAWVHGVIFPGEPGLAVESDCHCMRTIAAPTLPELIAFVGGELLIDPLAGWVRTVVGLSNSLVELVPQSKLAYAVVLYKLMVPGASAVYLFNTVPRLRKALSAVPKELEQLGRELGPAAVGA